MDSKLKDAPEETQGDLWPELDTTDPKQKRVLSLAKKYKRVKGERDEILSTAKEKEDSAKEALIAAMHECSVTKFRFDGIQAEIIAGKEKVQVKADDDADDTTDDE